MLVVVIVTSAVGSFKPIGSSFSQNFKPFVQNHRNGLESCQISPR